MSVGLLHGRLQDADGQEQEKPSWSPGKGNKHEVLQVGDQNNAGNGKAT